MYFYYYNDFRSINNARGRQVRTLSASGSGCPQAPSRDLKPELRIILRLVLLLKNLKTELPQVVQPALAEVSPVVVAQAAALPVV